jgi:HD-GYP domain-containing protein (c-di-GMP phosphodiesterase class II)
MLRVPIAYAKPGMILALPIFQPRRPDTVLLKEGLSLDARSVTRLAELRVPEVWIRYPGSEMVGEYISQEVMESHAVVTQRIGEAFEAVSSGAHAKLEYTEYKNAISALLEKLLANGRAAVFIQEMADRSQPVLRHASTVCMLSVLMGLKLDGYLVMERSRLNSHAARDVASLGVGAMLHDIGMLRLDPGVVHAWHQTLDETDPRFQKHVFLGHELVREAVGPAASAVVLHHHQKFDGSGFPRRIRLDGNQETVAGSDIHIFARIVAAADLFDRLRYPPGSPPEAAPLPVVRALRMMLESPYSSWIDPMVFKALLAVMPAYAPGTIVELNSGVRGLVTEWFPDDPCRPCVQELGDPTRDFDRGSPVGERYILRDTPGLCVVRVDGQDVLRDNFYPRTAGEFDLALAGRALLNAAARPHRAAPRAASKVA